MITKIFRNRTHPPPTPPRPLLRSADGILRFSLRTTGSGFPKPKAPPAKARFTLTSVILIAFPALCAHGSAIPPARSRAIRPFGLPHNVPSQIAHLTQQLIQGLFDWESFERSLSILFCPSGVGLVRTWKRIVWDGKTGGYVTPHCVPSNPADHSPVKCHPITVEELVVTLVGPSTDEKGSPTRLRCNLP